MAIPSSGDNLEDTKTVLVKSSIENFLKRCSQLKVTQKEITDGLDKIYKNDLLLTKEVYIWAIGKSSIFSQNALLKPSPNSEEEISSELPLFCEDTIYHASLCCFAASTQDCSNYRAFFETKFPNHGFEEVSFSISSEKETVDQYLIARKGKIYFIAFQSEQSFLKWPELYKSFEHGECMHVLIMI